MTQGMSEQGMRCTEVVQLTAYPLREEPPQHNEKPEEGYGILQDELCAESPVKEASVRGVPEVPVSPLCLLGIGDT